MKRALRYIAYGILVAGLLLGIALVTPSYLNDGTVRVSDGAIVNVAALESFIYYHEYHPAFALRQFVSRPISLLQTYTGMSEVVAFFLVQAMYIVSAVVTILFLAKEVFPRTFDIREELYTILGFVGTFSVLFAYGIPIYSYDDFVQYTCICLALLFGLRAKWWRYVFFCTLALFVRESTLILLPAFVLYLLPQLMVGIATPVQTCLLYARRIAIILSPAVLYYAGLFVASRMSPIVGVALAYTETERFGHFIYNVQTPLYAFESVLMGVLVCAFPTYLLVRALRMSGSHNVDILNRTIVPFVCALFCNTIITFVATRAQEARIFALPLIFIWPIMPILLSSLAHRISIRTIMYRMRTKIVHYLPMGLLCFVTLGVGYIAIWYSYTPTNYYTYAIGMLWYASMVFTLWCIDLYLTE